MGERGTSRGAAALMAACAAVALIPAPASAQQAGFNVSARDLGNALTELARQSNREIYFSSDLTRGRRAPALRGRMTIEEALTRLLAGTRLRYRINSSGAIVIEQASGEAQAGDAAADSESAETGATPDIFVVGRRTASADIRRTEDDIQPYVVIGQEEISRSQASDLQQLLRERLPMNAVQSSSSQSLSTGNTSSFNLRGLGTNQTLVLVDGRRMPGLFSRGSPQQPDVNGIPLSAIERIEILPTTASGIYGGGATGGVINIILRRNYSGIDLTATHVGTFAGGGSSDRIEGSLGFTLDRGRIQVMLSGSHSQARPLLAGQRNFLQRGLDLQFANDPSVFSNSPLPPVGRTTNICSGIGLGPGFGLCYSALGVDVPLVLRDGRSLGSAISSVPAGYAGPDSDGGNGLLSNAGRYNILVGNDGLYGESQALLNNPTVDSLMLNIRRSIGSRAEVFFDASWLSNRGRTDAGGGAYPSGFLAAGAPGNPFATDIVIQAPNGGLSAPWRQKSETLRMTGGAILRLGGGWNASGEYSWSRATLRTESTGVLLRDPDGAGPALSAYDAVSLGILNLLRDVNLYPVDYTPYLTADPDSVFGPARTSLQNATLRFSGPLLRVGGGPVTWSALLEARRERTSPSVARAIPADGTAASATGYPRYSQAVNSLYLEARAPLISLVNARSWARDLQLQAAIRHDRYTTRAPNPPFVPLATPTSAFPPVQQSTNEINATTYTLGLRYSPVRDLEIRASFGTGFLPPSISQIVPTPVTPPFLQTAIDPKRGNVRGPIGPLTISGGGNPDLRPEESRSWSVGAIWRPGFLSGARLSIDYTRIAKTDEISFVDIQTLLNLEDELPGRVTRGPLSAADQALGYTGGPITAVDTRLINATSSHISAVDIQADYDLSTGLGDYHFFAVLTWQPQLRRRVSLSAVPLDFVGFSDGPLEWRGAAGISWARGPWGLSWNVQYYHSYFVYRAGSSDATIDVATRNQGSERIGSQYYHDLAATYRFSAAPRAELLVGIQNVFNRQPAVIAVAPFSSAAQSYSNYGDPRLRRFTLSLRVGF